MFPFPFSFFSLEFFNFLNEFSWLTAGLLNVAVGWCFGNIFFGWLSSASTIYICAFLGYGTRVTSVTLNIATTGGFFLWDRFFDFFPHFLFYSFLKKRSTASTTSVAAYCYVLFFQNGEISLYVSALSLSLNRRLLFPHGLSSRLFRDSSSIFLELKTPDLVLLPRGRPFFVRTAVAGICFRWLALILVPNLLTLIGWGAAWNNFSRRPPPWRPRLPRPPPRPPPPPTTAKTTSTRAVAAPTATGSRRRLCRRPALRPHLWPSAASAAQEEPLVAPAAEEERRRRRRATVWPPPNLWASFRLEAARRRCRRLAALNSCCTSTPTTTTNSNSFNSNNSNNSSSSNNNSSSNNSSNSCNSSSSNNSYSNSNNNNRRNNNSSTSNPSHWNTHQKVSRKSVCSLCNFAFFASKVTSSLKKIVKFFFVRRCNICSNNVEQFLRTCKLLEALLELSDGM